MMRVYFNNEKKRVYKKRGQKRKKEKCDNLDHNEK